MPRPNCYYIKAVNIKDNSVLILSDNGEFSTNTVRPMYFKQPRLAVMYWKNSNVKLPVTYEVNVIGPRGGIYSMFYHCSL